MCAGSKDSQSFLSSCSSGEIKVNMTGMALHLREDWHVGMKTVVCCIAMYFSRALSLTPGTLGALRTVVIVMHVIVLLRKCLRVRKMNCNTPDQALGSRLSAGSMLHYNSLLGEDWYL